MIKMGGARELSQMISERRLYYFELFSGIYHDFVRNHDILNSNLVIKLIVVSFER